jgi:hypothetical protein
VPNYPTSLDTLTNPTASSHADDPGQELDVVISTLNDIAEALEAKVGTGAFVPTAAGDVLHAIAAGASAWGPRALTRLAETTLAAPAASISFGSIPTTYRHLLLIGIARDVGAGTSSALDINVNSAGSLDNQTATAAGATAAAAESLATGRIQIGYVTGGGAAAGLFAPSIVFFPHYRGTTHDKMAIGLSANKVGTASGNVSVRTGVGYVRTGTAAITLIGLAANSGANFAAGTVFTLYGLPA